MDEGSDVFVRLPSALLPEDPADDVTPDIVHKMVTGSEWNHTSAPCSTLAAAYKMGKELGPVDESTLHSCVYWRTVARQLIEEHDLVALKQFDTFLLSSGDLSASIGQKPKKTGANYCSINRFDSGLKSSIESLKTLGVASVFATGNDRDKSRVNYPACLTDAVAVASIGPRGNTEAYNNDSAELDFYALGRHELATENVSGTSAATAAFAAFWAKSYSNNYQMTYDYLKSIATTSDTNKNNTVIDVLK
jgi:hypothetical protein